jgi:hypothetical protein
MVHPDVKELFILKPLIPFRQLVAMPAMQQALYDAFYTEGARALFQWVHFTPHGVVAGSLSWPSIRPM